MSLYNVHHLHIDPKVFQHPSDKAISDKIQNNSAFSTALDFINKNGLERMLYSLYYSSFIHITERTGPELVTMCQEAADMFGLEKTPELFLSRSYDLFGRVMGTTKPVLLYSTEFIHLLDGVSLFGALACNVAATRTGYSQIRTIDQLVSEFGSFLPPIVTLSLRELLKQWRKTAQYTADRATLLAVGDFNLAMQVILSGEIPMNVLKKIDFADPNCSYMKQCLEFEADKGKVTNAMRTLNKISTSGAMYASRYLELYDFYHHEYDDLMEDYAQ